MTDAKETATNTAFAMMLVDNDHFVRVEDESKVPDGAIVVHSKEELEEQFSKDEAEQLVRKILKTPTLEAKDEEEAYRNLWVAATAQSAVAPAQKPAKGKKSSKNAGPRPSAKKYELLYDVENPGKSEDTFKDMAPQAQSLIEIMFKNTNSAKKEFQEDELRQIVKDAYDRGEFKTNQEPWRIFQYYRRKMVESKMIRINQ